MYFFSCFVSSDFFAFIIAFAKIVYGINNVNSITKRKNANVFWKLDDIIVSLFGFFPCSFN